MYGGHPYMHMGMPGTITLNYETNMALLHDIIASTSNVGYNKFIMLVPTVPTPVSSLPFTIWVWRATSF